MGGESLRILAVLGLAVAASELLARRTPLRHLGSALLVIVLTAIAANAGLIPTATDGPAVYDAVFAHVAPLGIFWLLLGVRLRGLAAVGLPLLVLFGVGALGTLAGVLAGMAAVEGPRAFGEWHAALAGMFVGTYVGGSVNFNAVALELGVVREAPLYAGAAVVDSAMTTAWMAATVVLPRLLRGAWSVRRGAAPTGKAAAPEADAERFGPVDLGLLLALGAAALWVSQGASAWLAPRIGFEPPAILILTTLALVLAQVPAVERIGGARSCGFFALMVFLAVIGALCDVAALRAIGPLGLRLSVFVAVAVLVHGVVVFGAAALLRWDPDTAAVASQANVGGGTSALALARSLGRPDLELPAVLVGSLGNAAGTYLGFLAVALLA